jgi:hypothetical protein
MKYAVETGSVAMIYIRSFIKIISGTQKLIAGIHRQHGDRISLLLVYENKKIRLKDGMSLPEIEPRLLGRPASSLVAIPNELPTIQ